MSVDSSTCIVNILLCFTKIADQFFYCKELKERTTSQDIFDTISTCLEENGLTWKECVGICMDGTPSMVGSINVFVSLAKKVIMKS